MDVSFDIITALRVLLTERSYITTSDKKNIFKLFKYKTSWAGEYGGYDIEIFKDIIREIFELAKNDITDRNIVLNALLETFQDDLGDEIGNIFALFEKEVSQEEMVQFRSLIEDEVENLEIISSLKRTEELLVLIRSSTGMARKKYLDEYKRLTGDVSLALKNVDRASATVNDVLLTGSGLKTIIRETLEEVKSPNSTLSTGSKYLDDMLGGGLESGELLIVAAPSGHGKSVWLLNMALGILHSNPSIYLKDETKIPYVAYISFENRPTLTFRRLAKYVLNLNVEQLKEVDEDILERKIDEHLSKLPIKLKMVYRKAYTVDAEIGLQKLIEGTMDEMGNRYECIAVFVDFLFLLKLDERLENRLALSAAARHLADLAIDEAIPVVTASQLNAEAELAKTLTKRTFGESKAVVDHCDKVVLFRREEHVFPVPLRHPLTEDEIKVTQFFECYNIKTRSAELTNTSRQIIPLKISNTFVLANELHDSTFALIGQDELNAELDVKYGITKQAKDKKKPAKAGVSESPLDMGDDEEIPY